MAVELWHTYLDSPLLFQWFLIGTLAGLWGSFLNMAIWRIPQGESIIFPRSHCPVCQHHLGFWDLIPILSWLWLRGSCRYCKTHFGSRYLVVEIALVVSWLFSYAFAGPSWLFVGLSGGSFFLLLMLGLWNRKRLDASILRRNRQGFTFIEVLMALMIVAAIIIPVGNIFLSSYTRVIRSREYHIGYNLLESKIAELKLIPPDKLMSDWNLYVKTRDYRKNIFRDDISEKYEELKSDEEAFYEQFTDVYTEQNQLPESVHRKFEKRYEDYYGLPFEFHPEGYESFRRVVQVQEVPSKAPAVFSPNETDVHTVSRLLKVTVTVTIDSDILYRKLKASFYRRK